MLVTPSMRARRSPAPPSITVAPLCAVQVLPAGPWPLRGPTVYVSKVSNPLKAAEEVAATVANTAAARLPVEKTRENFISGGLRLAAVGTVPVGKVGPKSSPQLSLV